MPKATGETELSKMQRRAMRFGQQATGPPAIPQATSAEDLEKEGKKAEEGSTEAAAPTQEEEESVEKAADDAFDI